MLDLLEIGIRVRGQRVQEQGFDPRPAKAAGRQADAVHDDELGLGRAGPRVAVRRVDDARAGEKAHRHGQGGHADSLARANRRFQSHTLAGMSAHPTNAAIVARDLAVVWHPCTQMHDHERLPLVPIARGEGVWLYDFEGRRYLDGISSWWVNLFGHANPRINAALAAQAGRLEHVLLAGFTHAPALELAEALTRLAPAGLTRCFFADNGSAAVEVAVKMSFHYWQNVGRPAEAPVRDALEQLPRRDARRARRRRRRAVQEGVPAAPDGRDHGALPRLPRARARRELGGAQPAHVRAHGGDARGARGRDRRRHRRAAGAMRRLDAHVPPRLSRAPARGLRPPRRAADRGRDRGRLRPHRHPLRLRAGGHPPGFPVPVEGTDGRLPAALGGPHHRDRVPRLLRRLPEADRFPAFAQLHRQSARLRGGAGDARHLPRRGRDRQEPRARAPHGGRACAARRPPARRGGAADRHDRGGRVREGPRDGRALRLARAARPAARTSTRSTAARCCARSATSCT